MRIIKKAFDTRVKGFTVCSCEADGDYFTIYINSQLNESAQRKALRHELLHIKRGDFYSRKNVQQIETEVRCTHLMNGHTRL